MIVISKKLFMKVICTKTDIILLLIFLLFWEVAIYGQLLIINHN